MILNVFLDDDNRVQRETPYQEVVEQPREHDLRDIEQEINVFREPDSTTHERRQSSAQRMPDRSGGEGLGEALNGSHPFFRQKSTVSIHGGR